MNIFNEQEFLEVCRRFGCKPSIQEVTIKYANSSFFNKMKNSIRRDRRGEVVFCVIRPNGSIVTVTCSEYPKGIFRIPTGGIGYGEDIVEAVFRETREELGVDTEIVNFAGVLKIRFEHQDEYEMFFSYLFILRETGGHLLEDASDDEVSEIREVNINGLEKVAGELGNIIGKWHDWGKFRYCTTRAILEFLKEHGAEVMPK